MMLNIFWISFPMCIWNLLCVVSAQVFCLFFFNLFILRGRERAHMHEQGRGREEDIGSEANTGIRVPHMGLELMNQIMTWAEVRCLTDWTTQGPLCFLFSYQVVHFLSVECLGVFFVCCFCFLRALCLFWPTFLCHVCPSQIFSPSLWLIFSFS